jgi:hypothetical protein
MEEEYVIVILGLFILIIGFPCVCVFVIHSNKVSQDTKDRLVQNPPPIPFLTALEDAEESLANFLNFRDHQSSFRTETTRERLNNDNKLRDLRLRIHNFGGDPQDVESNHRKRKNDS